MSKTDSSLFLHFLGNGAAFNPAFGNTSAYIQDEKRLFLLDCGETVFSRLTDQHILNSSQDIYAAVSHLHCDHAGSLGSLILYCYYGLHSPMTLVIPDNCDQYVKQIMSLLRFMGVSDDKYHLLSAEQLNFFKPFTSFSYIPTRHDPSMFCFSFTFDTPAGGVFYSADTSETDQLDSFLKAHPDPEALYMEATDEDYPGNIHLYLDKLTGFLDPSLRTRTYLMHFNRPSCAEKGRAAGFRIAIPDLVRC